MTRHLPALALMWAMAAQAAPVTCLPAPVGSGTAALFKSATKGDFAAWYCPGEQVPTMVVCLKSTCSLVATKRAVAKRLSEPTLVGLQLDAKIVRPTHFTDPNLVQVWLPFADEICALK